MKIRLKEERETFVVLKEDNMLLLITINEWNNYYNIFKEKGKILKSYQNSGQKESHLILYR